MALAQKLAAWRASRENTVLSETLELDGYAYEEAHKVGLL